MKKIADFLNDLIIRKVEPLPYHAMGEHKWGALGLSCQRYSVPTNDYATLTPSQDNGNVSIWILLPIAALTIYKMFGNTNNKRNK